MSHEHLDVLIVGAGLSGVGAGCHLQDEHPGKTYAILESRDAIGGTWDLFRYPGIRSDSDMQTLGYRFEPWPSAKAIADGPSIRDYIRDTAKKYGVEEHIRYGHKVVRADWSSADSRWHVTAERTDTGETVELTANFFYGCTGYYSYEEGFTPEFPGVERFKGQLIHPQQWPEDLDYSGKKVVVIGSGATAITLVPAMAGDAEHVTMLQRSPTYISSLPETDAINDALKKVLPEKVAYSIVRWKNVLRMVAVYQLSRRRPNLVKKVLRKALERQLPKGYDIATHFTPKYNPWDQRLCVVPNGDLFRSLRKGEASIVTDHIKTFTETGLELASGETLDADIIISATGLNLLAFGGMDLAVNGKTVELPETTAYKGMMLSGVPNFAFALGYTNASWTLKCDLTAEQVCRVLKHMDDTGARVCEPVADASLERRPFLDFSAGYVLRAVSSFPQQGDKAPWQVRQNYLLDLRELRRAKVDDGVLRFSAGEPAPAATRESEAQPA